MESEGRGEQRFTTHPPTPPCHVQPCSLVGLPRDVHARSLATNNEAQCGTMYSLPRTSCCYPPLSLSVRLSLSLPRGAMDNAVSNHDNRTENPGTSNVLTNTNMPALLPTHRSKLVSDSTHQINHAVRDTRMAGSWNQNKTNMLPHEVLLHYSPLP
ncbi:unnamed protein product, partial [Ectocarpus fasciculatus]